MLNEIENVAIAATGGKAASMAESETGNQGPKVSTPARFMALRGAQPPPPAGTHPPSREQSQLEKPIAF